MPASNSDLKDNEENHCLEKCKKVIARKKEENQENTSCYDACKIYIRNYAASITVEKAIKVNRSVVQDESQLLSMPNTPTYKCRVEKDLQASQAPREPLDDSNKETIDNQFIINCSYQRPCSAMNLMVQQENIIDCEKRGYLGPSENKEDEANRSHRKCNDKICPKLNFVLIQKGTNLNEIISVESAAKTQLGEKLISNRTKSDSVLIDKSCVPCIVAQIECTDEILIKSSFITGKPSQKSNTEKQILHAEEKLTMDELDAKECPEKETPQSDSVQIKKCVPCGRLQTKCKEKQQILPTNVEINDSHLDSTENEVIKCESTQSKAPKICKPCLEKKTQSTDALIEEIDAKSDSEITENDVKQKENENREVKCKVKFKKCLIKNLCRQCTRKQDIENWSDPEKLEEIKDNEFKVENVYITTETAKEIDLNTVVKSCSPCSTEKQKGYKEIETNNINASEKDKTRKLPSLKSGSEKELTECQTDIKTNSIDSNTMSETHNRKELGQTAQDTSSKITPRLSEYSASVLSFDENDEGNVLPKWKKTCRKGIYEINNLLDVCERNPDSVLCKIKITRRVDKKVPPDTSVEIIDETKAPYMEIVYGTNFGEPEYHFLMVNDSTSITYLELIKKSSKEELKSISTINESLEIPILVSSEDFELPFKESNEIAVEEESIEIPVKEGSIANEDITSTQISKPASDSVIEADEEQEKKYDLTRPSSVSWRSGNTPVSDSESAASLEQVIKDATTKAQNFRQNVDVKKQHSLLEMAKRKSLSETKIEDFKTERPPNKRKRFFNFKMCQKKKSESKKQKLKERDSDIENDVDESESEEESIEDFRNRPKGSTQTSLFKTSLRRNTSLLDNPVFEKKKELNQFLNNI